MISIKQILHSGARNPQDLLAVHFSHSGTYCARLRANGGGAALQAAEILPPVSLSAGSYAASAPAISKPLMARCAAICIPGDDAAVKLLNIPGQLEDDPTEQILGSLGLDQEKFRVAYRTMPSARGSRAETKVLTVAVPEPLAQAACGMFRTGIPAPISLEVDGLAALTDFCLTEAAVQADDAVGCIVSYSRVSFAAFFRKSELLLIRKFDFGLFQLLDMLQKNLGVDQATARDILVNGSFDVSQMVKTAMEPFVKQLVISKHFIERRDNCHVAKLFLAQEDWMAREWMAEIKSGVGVELDQWHPLAALQIPEGVLPQEIAAQPVRLSAAVGAALGLFAEQQPKS